jgi:malate synthase
MTGTLTSSSVSGIRLQLPLNSQLYTEVLCTDALAFIKALHERFNDRRLILLQKRYDRQRKLDLGQWPDFLPETASTRANEWKIAPIPAELQDRRVEITGPVDRKMIINALNSGAKVFMADFEDSTSPTWANLMEGQQNLIDAVRGSISYRQPETGKEYRLVDQPAMLFVRPRGLHLPEKHIRIHDEDASGSLIDFGLYFFHNANYLVDKGSAPYFYLPKLESYLEARLWNDIFLFSQNYLGIPTGSIKATVLIETLPAAFELHEILYELREHSSGLNCGRWDYIFSYIKKLRNQPGCILPDRAQVTMSVPCMDAYSRLVIQTCHRRGAHAMGGMSAFIPIKGNEEANEAAFAKVRADKTLEAQKGHDGTWVAHPGLVSTAMEVFNAAMPEANQIHKPLENRTFTPLDLLQVPLGEVTLEGLISNINIAFLYIESWLRGVGAAALYNLMEDAATAEISRMQVWQWVRYGTNLKDGRKVNEDLIRQLMVEEQTKAEAYLLQQGIQFNRLQEAVTVFESLVFAETPADFLTLPAYDLL